MNGDTDRMTLDGCELAKDRISNVVLAICKSDAECDMIRRQSTSCQAGKLLECRVWNDLLNVGALLLRSPCERIILLFTTQDCVGLHLRHLVIKEKGIKVYRILGLGSITSAG